MRAPRWEKTAVPSMVTLKTPPLPSISSGVIPNSSSILAPKLEAKGRNFHCTQYSMLTSYLGTFTGQSPDNGWPADSPDPCGDRGSLWQAVRLREGHDVFTVEVK